MFLHVLGLMLQLRALNRTILNDPVFQPILASPGSHGEALERHVDAMVERLREERARRARQAGPLSQLDCALDGAFRTDAIEHLDEPDFPERGKLAIASGLHLLNVLATFYRRFFALLAPRLRRIQTCHGRPARILELASGAGGFAFALASLAKSRGLDVEVTGSDIVPLYVERSRAKAAARGLPVSFRCLNAFDLSEVEEGAYDIVFVAQSAHHFSPGKLARMIAESRRVATTAFVSVDGYRSVSTAAFVAGTALLSMRPTMVHDAVISARKFYAEAELEAIAAMAVPGAHIRTGRIWPLLTTLTVRFDGEAS
jgi:SAM-dependent methyltransferase